MPLSASPSENIKSDIEPSIDLFMDFIIIIANFLRSLALLHCLDLSGCSIFVSAANIEHIGALKLLVSRVDVGGKDAANDVTEVRDIVDVGQC